MSNSDCIRANIEEIKTVVVGCVEGLESNLTPDDLKQTYIDTIKDKFIKEHEADIKSIKAILQIESPASKLAIGQAAINNFQLQNVNSYNDLTTYTAKYENGAKALFEEINELKFIYVFASSEGELKDKTREAISSLPISQELIDKYLSQPFEDHDDDSFSTALAAKKAFGSDLNYLRDSLDVAENAYNQNLIDGNSGVTESTLLEIAGSSAAVEI